MGTVELIIQTAPIFFNTRERASVASFTVGYLLRIRACASAPKDVRPIFEMVRFAFPPLLLINLMSLLPFYAVPS